LSIFFIFLSSFCEFSSFFVKNAGDFTSSSSLLVVITSSSSLLGVITSSLSLSFMPFGVLFSISDVISYSLFSFT